MARRPAKAEGIFIEFSSGASAAAAMHLLQPAYHKCKTTVVLLCDSGLKYPRTDLWK
jgi:cysteine synthase